MTTVSHHKRPVIGVVPTQVNEKLPHVELRDEYIHAIVSAGGSPLILPLCENAEVYEALFPTLDGFLLSGGNDIDPVRYDNTTHDLPRESLTPVRDSLEYYVLSYAYKYDVPVLGICRGMQMMNVFFGGDLYTDIELDFQYPSGITEDHRLHIKHLQDASYGTPTHDIHVVPGSTLSKIVPFDTYTVNSLHHQAIKSVGKDIEILAHAPDGIIEAISVKTQTWMLGVQWHPEYFAGNDIMGPLFQHFVEQAGLSRVRNWHRRQAQLRIFDTCSGTDRCWPDMEYITFAENI
ncbi:MAG: gamma-glutamyl-gamma-aminobutyrate hydrolase family protein [Eggerthellaceae bacterium]|nr:gamma-glutamyl-gamma-aminobutyrate hydrolase family protein [Eggerthellaceae bacterium]